MQTWNIFFFILLSFLLRTVLVLYSLLSVRKNRFLFSYIHFLYRTKHIFVAVLNWFNLLQQRLIKSTSRIVEIITYICIFLCLTKIWGCLEVYNGPSLPHFHWFIHFIHKIFIGTILESSSTAVNKWIKQYSGK